MTDAVELCANSAEVVGEPMDATRREMGRARREHPGGSNKNRES